MPSASSDLTDVIAGALRACELPQTSEPPRSVAAGGRGASPTARRVTMLLVACTVLSVGVGYAGAQLGLAERGFGVLLEQLGVRTPTVQRTRRPRAPQVPASAAVQQVVRQDEALVAAAQAVQAPTAAKRAQLAPVIHPVAAGSKFEARALSARASKLPRVKTAERGRAAKFRDSRAKAIALASTTRANSLSFPAAAQQEPAPAPQALPSSPAGAGPETVQAAAPQSASRLFERANRARHRGLSGEARVLYAELRAHYPDSAEARLSQALVARLQLDQGELDAALSGFEAYLSGPDRALHEEAMVGRVRALSRLGRLRDAAAAAQSLLKAHPRSAFAEEAEALVERVERD